jgi:hypothetical protein
VPCRRSRITPNAACPLEGTRIGQRRSGALVGGAIRGHLMSSTSPFLASAQRGGNGNRDHRTRTESWQPLDDRSLRLMLSHQVPAQRPCIEVDARMNARRLFSHWAVAAGDAPFGLLPILHCAASRGTIILQRARSQSPTQWRACLLQVGLYAPRTLASAR